MKKTQQLGFAACILLAGCSEWKTQGNIGGANQGVRAAGNRQGGIALEEGEIAVAPNGRFFVTLKNAQLAVGDVGSERAEVLQDIASVERVAFWTGENGEGLFILTDGKKQGADGKPETVISWSRSEKKTVWRKELPRRDRWLDVNSTGNRIVLTGDDILLADASTGSEVGTHLASSQIPRDVDLTRDGRFLIITEETAWDGTNPHTRMEVRRTDDGSSSCETTADNCADELVLSDDESTAFLAPTLCQKDPVSVVKIQDGHCEIAKQLPGFGPVALSPDGKTAVAFIDRDAPATQGFPEVPAAVKQSKLRYHLMLIDTHTLDFRTTGYADVMPRYAFTGTGSDLLVDMPMDPLKQVEIFDVKTLTKRVVAGAPIKLNVFTLSPDGKHAFVVNDGLFEIDVEKAQLSSIPVKVNPGALNSTPDGHTVLVGSSSEHAVVFMDASSKKETGRASY